MSNPWFRMYAEFSHDPKIQMLSEAMQRRYVMLMCMRCSNTLVTLHETEVAFHLRISNEEMAETKALFIAKGFIDKDFNLLNWEKRQFISDTSNERVKRHRAKRAEQGLPQQNSIPASVRVAVFGRDDCACVYCGAEDDLTIDHMTPQSRGGGDEMENLATACRACNASKRDLTSDEFIARKAGNVTVTPYIQKQITDTEQIEAKAPLPSAVPDCPHETLIDLFEKQLPNLAQPKKSLWRVGKNAPAMKARWRWVMTATHEKGERTGQRLATTKDEAIAWFERYFAYVARSEFLTGGSSDWACDLGWLVNAANFEKVLAGNYENKLKAVA